MSEGAVPKPDPSDWSNALLTSGTEALLGAVRNYIGPVKTPYDKRDLVGLLEAFLRRAETRSSLFALLDSLDVRILGTSLLLGPVPEQALRDIFSGELPLFELGVKISNLLDRLLLFRYQVGGKRLIAVNPLLEDELRARALDPATFFGQYGDSARDGAKASPDAVDAKAVVGFFSFLFHSPLSIRKGGGLTKRATDRAASLFPELSAAGGDRLGALAQALSAVGVLPVVQDEERCPDRLLFSRLLSEWSEELPWYLAAGIAIEGSSEGEAARLGEIGRRAGAASLSVVLASAFESLPEGLALPKPVLARWLRIVARRARFAMDPAAALEPLEELGVLAAQGEGLVPRRRPAPAAGTGASLVVEGAHGLHLMPEASLEDRLFVGCVSRPLSMGVVWSFEVERDTVRRAFSSGLSAAEIRSRFESLSGGALPQSFAFSLSEWEEEYRSLRLYRGFTLVADERLRSVIERSTALGKMTAERLAPGVYFLSAATGEEAIAALAAAGLEAPPSMRSEPPRRDSERTDDDYGLFASPPAAARGRIDALRDLVASGWLPLRFGPAPLPNPEPRLSELRATLASSGRSDGERRELADRIERRLVLTERQIAHADPRPERLEAGGLDYLGKVRVVEMALRTSGDRLEVLYRLPGAEPVRALLRPIRLDKNEKGLVLEAEDLGTGGPARVPLGAVSTVRRVRASLFGEDQ